MSTCRILHIDDDDGDEFFLRRAVKNSQASFDLRRVSDGAAAMAYLQGEGDFSDRAKFPFPDAVVLDLKMPRISGYEVLDWIRSRPEFNRLPVIILTSSSLYKDKERVTALGATAFLTKTITMEHIPEQLQEILGKEQAGIG